MNVKADKIPNARSLVRRANDILVQAIDRLPPIGNWLQVPLEQATDALVVSGIRDKFSVTDSREADRRRKEAIERFKAGEERLRNLPPIRVEGEIAELKTYLAQVLADFKLDFSNGWVGPGETFESLGGYLGFVRKLRAVWTVTPNCRDLLCSWANGFRLVRRYIAELPIDLGSISGFVGPVSPRIVLDRIVKNYRRIMATDEHHHKCLYQIRLQSKLSFVEGSRFTTVAKNNKDDRGISVEPLGNSIIQKIIGYAFRVVLSALGNTLDDGKKRHQRMVASGRYACIDLKDASDSIRWTLIKAVFPPFVVKLIAAARSPSIYIDGEWVPLVKVSSMGNGFTFELMTLLILSHLRSNLKTTDLSVFGDDVLVPYAYYDRAIRLLEGLGFVVNTAKSSDDPERAESCGSFRVGQQIVVRYDFREMESIHHVVITHNKLAYLVKAGQVSRPIKYWLLTTLKSFRTVTRRIMTPTHQKFRAAPIWEPTWEEIPSWLVSLWLKKGRIFDPACKAYHLHDLCLVDKVETRYPDQKIWDNRLSLLEALRSFVHHEWSPVKRLSIQVVRTTIVGPRGFTLSRRAWDETSRRMASVSGA